MAYRLPAQVLKAGAPTASDDATKGFVVGSIIINTAVSPRVAYVCTNNAASAATWAATTSTTTTHAGLATLGWTAAGHTAAAGTPKVAAFDATGAAQVVPAATDGQTLQRIGGAIVFAALTGAVMVSAGSDDSYAVRYILRDTSIVTLDLVATGPGTLV